MIRIGTAGWAYADWEGIVYPARHPKGFDPLAHLATFLDAVEVNSSFYRIPEPAAAASWAERVRANPDFRFTVKLWRGFTHEEGGDPRSDEAAAGAFRAAVAPLSEAGILAAILVQFPYRTHNTGPTRARMSEILDRLEGLPLAVEIRHASWLRDPFFAMLKERGVAFCNIDQPALSLNVPPTAHATAPLAYVRLHGRNAETWFEEGAEWRRYDYLYSAEELAGWASRIASLAASSKDVIVIANNHYRGQAAANAAELRAILGAEPKPVPAGLVDTYPRLAGRVPAAAGRGAGASQGSLPFR